MVAPTSNHTKTRVSIRITGRVQGVGFRPYIYRLATQFGLTGWVMNDGNGVCIEIQGEHVKDFLQHFSLNLPPLAEIKAVECKPQAVIAGEQIFIIKSTKINHILTTIGSDTAICSECLNDLFNKSSRYFQYPFVSCTNCGPRYSITNQLPFDRENTSMVSFHLCKQCQVDYTDPHNRRFHAQTIACHQCGPQLSHSISDIAQKIMTGGIVAVKSLGGFQLICDAHNLSAIKKIRQIKERNDKPFAIMVLNEDSATRYVTLSARERDILTSQQRPIVISEKCHNDLPSEIAPNLSTLGVMLPNTPLHYLLFEKLFGEKDDMSWLRKSNDIALLVTSANEMNSPILTNNKDAEDTLANITELVVSFNREIVTHLDDSVIRMVDNQPFFIRRARGFSLESIELSHAIPSTLALGGYLKNTLCITRNNEAYVSQHIGNLSNVETIKTYHATLKHMLKLLNIKPECIAHDLHPHFYSSQFATQFNIPAFAIQHHHAHLATVAAQSKCTQHAIGLALDGFGLGDDDESWGGELMLYQTTQCERLGHLQPLIQPGGDMVAKEPWRMAVSALFTLNRLHEIKARFSSFLVLEQILQLLKQGFNSPVTSSCGRLFDAASALLGICHNSTYEAQAAMLLESKVTTPMIDKKGWAISNNQLNMLPLFVKLLDCDQVTGANLFHGTLSAALTTWVVKNAKEFNISKILLSGGCFLNQVLLRLLINELKQNNLTPIFPDYALPNDAGLSLGQAWVAGNKMMEKK